MNVVESRTSSTVLSDYDVYLVDMCVGGVRVGGLPLACACVHTCATTGRDEDAKNSFAWAW